MNAILYLLFVLQKIFLKMICEANFTEPAAIGSKAAHAD